MKQNKKRIIGSIVLITLTIISIFMWNTKYLKKEEPQEGKTEIKTPQNNFININENIDEFVKKDEQGVITDKETGEVIYDPKEDYEEKAKYYSTISDLTKTPDKIDDAYLSEYLKYVYYAYPAQSIESFGKEEMAIIVAQVSQMYVPRTEEEIQQVAKKYFGVDNFELPEGEYYLKNGNEYTIVKENGKYIQHDRVFNRPKEWPYIVDIKIDGETIIINSDYAVGMVLAAGCYIPEYRNEECITGYYKTTLKIKGDSLIIDKIEYTPNEKYQNLS